MFVGSLVVFFEHRRLVAGICIKEDAQRLHIVREDGESMCISSGRVMRAVPVFSEHESVSHDALLEEMCAYRKRREAVRERVLPQKLWESLPEKGCLYSVEDLARAAFGAESAFDHEVAVLEALVHERIHFKLQGKEFLARFPEQCLEKRTAADREALRQQECDEAVAWIRSVQKGTEAQCAKRGTFIAMLQDYVVFGKGAQRYADSRSILRRTHLTAPEKCFRFLVDLGVWDEDENILLRRHGLSSGWSTDARRQEDDCIRNVLQQMIDDPERRDVTSQYTVSIDEHMTKDVDDALSFSLSDEGARVGIHITDVASCILPGTSLDREALIRGASLYLPEGKISMIPPGLSEQALSLVEGERRPALSFMLTLKNDGTVTAKDVFLSVVTVDRKLRYDEADVMIEQDPAFATLYALARALRRRRLAGGAFSFQLPELQVRVDDGKKITTALRDKESPAQALVAECMIAANYHAAVLLKEHGMPALYRKQAQRRVKEQQTSGDALFDLFSRRKSFGRVFFSVRPGPHSGLGLDCYTTVTSPVRKYHDLVSQRQIVSLIRQESPACSADQLQAIADELVPALARNTLVEQERKRYWLLKVLNKRLGERLGAVVMKRRWNSCTVMLRDYLMEVSLKEPEGERLMPGSSVNVCIESAEPFTGAIKLRLIS